MELVFKKSAQKTQVNNKNIYAFESKEALINYIADKQKILVALNAEKLSKSASELDIIINENIGYADGIGAVWALRKKGKKSIKIAGAELWLDIIDAFKYNKSFYFIGATQEVMNKTIKKLRTDYPNIQIAGYRNGYFKEEEVNQIKEDIKKSEADVVFVAQGSPRQEFLMNELKRDHPALYMGLGGSFDVYVGAVKRAPRMFIKLGLEWFYRLLQEPKRWRRQVQLLQFLYKLQLNKY